MNDFTKEELCDIAIALNWQQGQWLAEKWGIDRSQLITKINSMIDNYCDPKQIDGFARHPTDYTQCNHDWHELGYAPNSYVVPTIICSKCRALHFIRDKNDN